MTDCKIMLPSGKVLSFNVAPRAGLSSRAILRLILLKNGTRAGPYPNRAISRAVARGSDIRAVHLWDRHERRSAA